MPSQDARCYGHPVEVLVTRCFQFMSFTAKCTSQNSSTTKRSAWRMRSLADGSCVKPARNGLEMKLQGGDDGTTSGRHKGQGGRRTCRLGLVSQLETAYLFASQLIRAESVQVQHMTASAS